MASFRIPLAFKVGKKKDDKNFFHIVFCRLIRKLFPTTLTLENAIAPAAIIGLSNPSARGTESFYGKTETSKQIAEALVNNVAETLGVPNRGAKPDTQTAVGSLGWIRKTTMWASLIEVCFLTNPDDMQVLHSEGGYEKAARGIVNGVCEIFGVPKLPNLPPPEVGGKDREKIKLQIIELVNQL